MPPIGELEQRGLVRELAAGPEGAWVTGSGRSMEPTVRPGDRVRVRAGLPVRRGDVALLERRAPGGGYILHRVVFAAAKLGWIVHCGDAPGSRPGVAPATALVGRAELPNRPIERGKSLAGLAALARAAGRRLFL